MHAEWDRLINAVIRRKYSWADTVNVSYEDMLAAGRLGAVEAMRSWDPSAKSKQYNWIYFKVRNHISRLLAQEGKYCKLKRYTRQHSFVNLVLVKNALDQLKCSVSDLDWMLFRAVCDGVSCTELASQHELTVMAVYQRVTRVRREFRRIWN